ncbi:MAG: formylglycine-generating enzyme family protein [Anaerolineae bacterium]
MTESLRADGPVTTVPTGSPPVVDGILAPGEWAGAYEDRLSDGSSLLLMQDEGYLYVAIRANGTGSGVVSLCIDHGDQISILHSSAALGTAVYQRHGASWQRTQDFQWKCRSTDNSPSAQAERVAFLEEEGWLANNGRMGVPQEVEYQIAVLGGSLRLAVTYLGPPDFDAVTWWPPGLEDDCRNRVMLQGPLPEVVHFAPEVWERIALEDRPLPNLGETWTRPADGMEMVYVPGGTFQMGSSDAQVDEARVLCERYPDKYGKCQFADFANESPHHSVTLDGFWIDRTEVTNVQYRLCTAGGGCRESQLANNPAYNGEDYPVAGIPWQGAADYCAWAGGRLPTEAEWEYAARGPDGTLYPWGNEFNCTGGNFWDDATGCDDGYPEPAPVGSFPGGVSWCGALDMAGNVWEWVSDAYGAYPAAAQMNPTGPVSGSDRILRGGSWGYHQPFVRTAYRYRVAPSADYLAVGFRCVVPAGSE